MIGTRYRMISSMSVTIKSDQWGNEHPNEKNTPPWNNKTLPVGTGSGEQGITVEDFAVELTS